MYRLFFFESAGARYRARPLADLASFRLIARNRRVNMSMMSVGMGN